MKYSLKKQGTGLMRGLVIQFLLGMYINLYVSYPEAQGPKEYWHFTTHNLIVLAHLIIGSLLVIGSIVLVVRAFRTQSQAWRLPSIAGMISLLVAWGAGDAFVTTQQDGFSFLMAFGFLAGLLSYAWGMTRDS